MSSKVSWLRSGQLNPRIITILRGGGQVFIAGCIIAAGVLLAYLITSPYVDLTLSIVGVLVHVLIILVNPLSGLLFWYTFYPFTEKVINIPLPAGIPDLSPTRFTIVFIATMILAQVAIRKRTWPRLTKTDWAIIAFMIATIIPSLSSSNLITEIQFNFDTYLLPFIIYFLIKNLVTNKEEFDRVIKVLLIIGLYAAVYIIFEQTTSYVIDFGKPSGQIITFRYSYRAYTESLRLAEVWLLGGIAVLGLIFNMMLPFAFYYMFKTSSSMKKAGYAFLIGLMLVGLFFTYKRAVFFNVPISFLVIQFFYPKFRRVFLVMLVVFGLLLAVTWNQVSQSALVTERLDQGDITTANGRTDIWETAIKLWKKRPLFGYGFSNFERVFQHDGTTENFYLMVLVSVGVVGLTPYILMLIFIVMESIGVYRQIGLNPYLFVDRELVAVFWGSFLTYVLKSFSGNQAKLVSNVMFMVIIGAVVGSQQVILARHKKKKLPDE